jgi:hypothetical protein
MQAEDVLESRLTAIQNFLTANGATVFAKLLYNLPQLYQAVMSPKLTMIIAPTDESFEWLSNETQRPLAELLNSEAGRNLLSNHISVLPTQKVYPMFTAINGVTYGSGPEDLAALKVTASTIIDGVVVLVASSVIGRPQQLTKSKRREEPGVFAGMTRDAFQALINTGNLRGKDLIALCNTNPYVDNTFCNSRDASGRTIFHYLIKREFNIDISVNEDSRNRYVELHKEAQFKQFPTTGIFLDQGPNFDVRNVRRGGRRDILVKRPYIQEMYKANYPSRQFFKHSVDEDRIRNLSTDSLIHAIWSHPIDLYLIVSVYNSPITISYRTSLVRATRDAYGKYISDSGERFSVDTDPERHNPVVTCGNIDAGEVPIKSKLIHYTHPYPETLPFLYDRRVKNYDLDDLKSILEDIYRLLYNERITLEFLEDMPEDPRSIVEILGTPRLSQRNKVDFAIRQSVCSTELGQLVLTDEDSDNDIGVWIAGALQVRIPLRFYNAYKTIPRNTLLVILELLLLFSGAIETRDATIFTPSEGAGLRP